MIYIPRNKFCMIWVSDSYLMALPEGMKVEATYLTTILAEDGPPQKKFLAPAESLLVSLTKMFNSLTRKFASLTCIS